NGMSPSNRGSAWSNSGMVVETRPEDFTIIQRQLVTEHSVKDVSPEDPLCMMHLQVAIEQATWIQGGKRQTAPAQRMTDFVSGRLSRDLPQTSYSPGVIASPLHFWLPKFLTSRLQEGFKSFGHRSRGFLSQEAVVIATETRTSSPVRIVRDGETLQSPSLPGLFPCGEGAGYAGGIVSSAVDGERCAEAVCRYLDAN
ncbi:MAG: FAD-binding protein, partial [Bacteroidaceae bacterium]|nr:FAD-binding protein [Bacteroidaceae bacterium]